MSIKKICATIYVALICFSFVCTPLSKSTTSSTVFAQELAEEIQDISQDFAVNMDTVYTIDTQGVTSVSHQIKIVNKKPTLYLKQYTFSTSFSNLNGIVVLQNNVPLPVNTYSTKDGTTIGITFDDEVVGQGKNRIFTIQYKSDSIADISGAVLELHIPQISSPEQFSSLTTTVYTPVYFSKPTYITTEPKSIDFIDSQTKMVFEGASAKPISAFFGSEQVYSLALQYNLENSSSSPILTQISLPPDTQFQKIHIHSLEPRPEQMKTDADGNWIATYQVPAASVTIVTLQAQAKLTLEPNNSVASITPRSTHTQARKYWESNSTFITEKAKELNTAEAIYAYVVDTLTYPDMANIHIRSIKRLGAVAALTEEGNTVCQEYADAFVALSRAANIPSRRLIGYAYTNDATLKPSSFDGDILHAWAEYYDPATQIWRQVDPTWGDTTGGVDYLHQFDLNHIVFAINGNSDSLPNPAGSYKISDSETKDVTVSISDRFPESKPDFSAVLTQKKLFSLPIPGLYTLNIDNNSGQALYNLTTTIVPTEQTDATNNHVFQVDKLIPFQKHQEVVRVYNTNTSLLTKQPAKLIISQEDVIIYESDTTIIAGPEWLAILEQPEIPIYLAAGLGVATALTWGVLVFRRRRKRSIRR